MIGTTKQWLLDLLEKWKDQAVNDDDQTWNDVARFDYAIALVEKCPEEPTP